MAVREPLETVRDAVHRATRPLRGGPTVSATGLPTDTDAEEHLADERCEELDALRAAEEHLGADADRAARATHGANAYLAARRRRLRRQLQDDGDGRISADG